MEYCSYGSLQNLIHSTGSIPEKILKQITIKILKSMETFSNITETSYESICPNNLLFDKELNVKVNSLIILLSDLAWIEAFILQA